MRYSEIYIETYRAIRYPKLEARGQKLGEKCTSGTKPTRPYSPSPWESEIPRNSSWRGKRMMEVLLLKIFFQKSSPVRESLVLFLVWHFDTFATLNFDPKTWSRGSQEGGMEKIGRELSGRELSTWVVSTRKPWSDNVRMCCLKRTQYHNITISLHILLDFLELRCSRATSWLPKEDKPSRTPLEAQSKTSEAKRQRILCKTVKSENWNQHWIIQCFPLKLIEMRQQRCFCLTLRLVTSCIWAAKWAMPRRLAELVATATVFSHFSWNLQFQVEKARGRKEWSKVGIRKNWMHPTAGTSKRPRFQTLWLLPLPWLRCYGLSRSRNRMKDQNKTVKNEHKREREEQPHQKLWTR